MKYASIDIGTNTLRLLVAEVDSRGALKPLIYDRAITRLGGGYTEGHGIDGGSAERTLSALEAFKEVLTGEAVESVVATATSVVRRARNRDRFLREIEERTGIRAEVISGEEEARLSLIGVLSVLNDTSGRMLVVDIGGGSTEFIAAEGGALLGSWSMEMGVVHLTEDYLKNDPPEERELRSMEASVSGVLRELKARMEAAHMEPSLYGGGGGSTGARLVGTAGTITTLAALDQDLDVYDRDKINNYTLTRERVAELYRGLAGITMREREKILSLEKGREDLIIPGSAIVFLTMEAFGFGEMTVSDAGLLEGIIIDGVRKGAETEQTEV